MQTVTQWLSLGAAALATALPARRGKFLTVLAVLCGVLVVGTLPSAQATAILTLSDSLGHSATVLDPLNTGLLTFNGALGNFNVNVTTGLSKPVIGDSDHARLDLSSVNVSGLGAGVLTIQFTDIDFTLPIAQDIATSSLGGVTDGSVSFTSFLDNSNTPFGTGTLLASLGPLGPGAFSGSSTGAVTTHNPFSLTERVIITQNAGAVTSFNAAAEVVVPEPSSLLFLATGLASLLGSGWYRRKRVA